MKTYVMESSPDNSGMQETKPEDTFQCFMCGGTFPAYSKPSAVPKAGGGHVDLVFANYQVWVVDDNNEKHCKKCSGELWTKWLGSQPLGARISLYLTSKKVDDKRVMWYVTTWDESFKQNVFVRHGRHNMAGNRHDCWFRVGDTFWHGVNMGDNEILHCKAVKLPRTS